MAIKFFNTFGLKIKNMLARSDLDEAFWSELEETLVGADVGIELTTRLINSVRRAKNSEEVKNALAESLMQVFEKIDAQAQTSEHSPHVVLVLGVNGVGKTTTIAKLAYNYKTLGKKVLLVAADTYRAAAIEQLQVWASRIGVDILAEGPGTDSAAVAFDGVQKAVAKKYDVVLIDTAGRLHTKQNLMEELKKVSRVIGKAFVSAPHEKLLVLDATVGSNGLNQAKEFHNALGLTGIVVTKLDGTAKGGIVFAIADSLKIPVTHIGLGEGIDDLKPFNFKTFVASILS